LALWGAIAEKTSLIATHLTWVMAMGLLCFLLGAVLTLVGGSALWAWGGLVILAALSVAAAFLGIAALRESATVMETQQEWRERYVRTEARRIEAELRLAEEHDRFADLRMKLLGWVVQPLPGETKDVEVICDGVPDNSLPYNDEGVEEARQELEEALVDMWRSGVGRKRLSELLTDSVKTAIEEA